MKHTVKSGFHTNPVKINLVGVGGGGSLVLSGLKSAFYPRLD